MFSFVSRLDVIKMKTPFDNYHVMPVGDLKKHRDDIDCWCNPNIEYDFPPYVVVHWSADRREYKDPEYKYNRINRA